MSLEDKFPYSDDEFEYQDGRLRRENEELRKFAAIFVKHVGEITITDSEIIEGTNDGYIEVIIDGKKPSERTYKWVKYLGVKV